MDVISQSTYIRKQTGVYVLNFEYGAQNKSEKKLNMSPSKSLFIKDNDLPYTTTIDVNRNYAHS